MNEVGLSMQGTTEGRIYAVTEEILAKIQNFHFMGPSY